MERQHALRDLGTSVLLAVLYAGVARLGLMLDAVSGFATLVWPPSGIALAAVLLLGRRVWPGIAAGALAVNLWVGAPLWVALGISTGNTLEALAGAWILERLGFSRDVDRVRDALALIVPAALGSTLISATVGVASLGAGGVIPWARAAHTWQAWWLGDLIGDLVVAPLLLAWSANLRIRPRGRELLEALGLAGALVAVSAFVFGGRAEAAPLRQAFLLLPLSIWAALRFGQRGGTIATFAAATFAIWGTVEGLGPFVRDSLSDSLIALQAFLAAVAVTTLLLGAAVLERRRAVEARDELIAIVSHDLKGPLI